MAHSASLHNQPATEKPVLVHELPVGSRVMRYGFGVSVMSGEPLWWCDQRRIWTDLEDNISGLASNAPCRTVKAFKRHLRRHADVLAGREVVWAGRFGAVTADLRTRTAVEGPSVGTQGEARSEPKNTPANGDSQ